MRELIFIADRMHGHNLWHYITFTDKIGNQCFMLEGNYYSHDDFAKYIQTQKPKRAVLAFDAQDEFEYIIYLISDFIEWISISPKTKHNRQFDFRPFEKCSMLEFIEFTWNTKQDSLWDVKKNTHLKSFIMTDYYKVSDFSSFRGSSISLLRLFGCNSLSSFTSKMHIDDFGFVADMPCLKELRIDIVKDKPSEYYLNILSKCTNLEILCIPDSFFTFQQFAYLKSKLPQVKEGLDCVENYSDDCYSIIGRRTPKSLDDIAKAEKYQKRYDTLVEKYKNRTEPPSDEEKDI